MGITRPPFRPFDEHRAVRIYQRNLPHWRQDGATYFVTIRQCDSIPDDIRRQWEDEKRRWLSANGFDALASGRELSAAVARLSPMEQWRFERHFNRQIQGCLDRGLGACHLRKPECIDCLIEKLFAGDGERYHLGDFIVMPNHVHLLITPTSGNELEDVMKGIKGASATECNRTLGRSGTFWQADSYDHIVRSLEQVYQYRKYIADNPRKAGIHVAESARHVAEWMDDWFKT